MPYLPSAGQSAQKTTQNWCEAADGTPLGRTGLHASAKAGYVGACQLLLEQLGVEAYVFDNTGMSAMMLAASHGHHRVIKVCRGSDACSRGHSHYIGMMQIY